MRVKSLELERLSGRSQTALVEGNETLKLVYVGKDGEGVDRLVDSLPNEVPLFRDRNVYALELNAFLHIMA